MAMQAILILIIQRSLSVKLLLFSQMDLSNLGFHRSDKERSFHCACVLVVCSGVFGAAPSLTLPDPCLLSPAQVPYSPQHYTEPRVSSYLHA